MPYPEFNRDPSLFFIDAQLTPGTKHDDVEKRMLAEIERVQKDGVQADEVATAIAKYTASTAYERDGSMAMAFALNECIAAGDWSLYYALEDAVKNVTPADVQRVAKKYFSEDQRTTGWYMPRNDAPADHGAAADNGGESTDSQAAEKHEQGKVCQIGSCGAEQHPTRRPSRVPRRRAASRRAPLRPLPRLRRESCARKFPASIC